MKDLSKFKLPPVHAEGHVCIDLTDPDTGKVVDRVKGKNHVFLDALLSGYPWWDRLEYVYLMLSDDNSAIDPKFPYMLGNVVGYGVPSNSGSGKYQGAYNSANQVLADITSDSIRWKFQYDFTTAQANGTIRSIGLTYQYNSRSRHLSAYEKSVTRNAAYKTCDGRCSYTCSTAGIITVYDNWMYTNATIDVSATVGTSSSVYKYIGYAPVTGKYYIYTYSSTANDRYMYVFSDNSFLTLETTYYASNISIGSSTYPMYIYGDYAFWCTSTGGIIYYADFVNNTAYVSVENDINDPINSNYNSSLNGIGCAYDKYILCGRSYSSCVLYIFDMSQKTFVGRAKTPYDSSTYYPLVHYPLTDTKLFCQGSSFEHRSAITKYILPTPITKTSDKGMTATYELEVFW